MMIDSRPETYEHILPVNHFLNMVICDLLQRGADHDQSKLFSPEVEVFDEHTEKLKTLTYGSEEYQSSLRAIKPALDHHYAHNSHHPEHWGNGIEGMALTDIVEMLADWKAATLRHDDGDLLKSIEHNAKRFGIDDQLAQVLVNTARSLGWV